MQNNDGIKPMTILLTGGGSAGHVTPNLALIERFQQEGWKIVYAGSEFGVEKNIIEKQGLPYISIASGKLRRYFSWQNFLDPLKILRGIFEATVLCRRLKPDVVFSKGGFVAFPVVLGAWLNRIPVVAHESDFTPGLANRLSFPFSKAICITFPPDKHFFKDSKKVIVTGTPLRSALMKGVAARGLELCHFSSERPVILVMGGGLGASSINTAIRQALPELLKNYQVAHICGAGKCDPAFEQPGYQQFEYVHESLADLFAATSMVVSRAGANSIYEFIALTKPHLLIPLSKKASRGDQIENADYFSKQGLSLVLAEEQLNAESLLEKLNILARDRETFVKAIKAYPIQNSVDIITEIVRGYFKKSVISTRLH